MKRSHRERGMHHSKFKYLTVYMQFLVCLYKGMLYLCVMEEYNNARSHLPGNQSKFTTETSFLLNSYELPFVDI